MRSQLQKRSKWVVAVVEEEERKDREGSSSPSCIWREWAGRYRVNLQRLEWRWS